MKGAQLDYMALRAGRRWTQILQIKFLYQSMPLMGIHSDTHTHTHTHTHTQPFICLSEVYIWKCLVKRGKTLKAPSKSLNEGFNLQEDPTVGYTTPSGNRSLQVIPMLV